MIKKTIKYVDWNGVDREEDFYFNLTKTELTRMQYDEEGDFGQRITNIIRAKDQNAIMRIFESIILKSYGEKSQDGRRFIKSEEISKSFTETPAYDQLYFELVTDPDKFGEFINSLIPADLADKVAEIQKSGNPIDVITSN